MKALYLIVLSLLSMMLFTSCDKSEDILEEEKNPDNPQIEMNTSEVLFATDGGNNTISFNTTENWTAHIINSRADTWCTIYPTSGSADDATITVTTTPNDTPNDRTASIVIEAGTASKTISVSQKQKDALTVTSSKFEVGSQGGQIVIGIDSNVDYEIEISDDWIKQITTRSLQSSSPTFEIQQNTDKKDRQGFVKFASKNGTISQTVYINQSCANGNTEDIENGDINEW